MKARSRSKPMVCTAFRLPAEVHAALTDLAEQEERSVNAQVVYLIRQAVDKAAERGYSPQEHEVRAARPANQQNELRKDALARRGEIKARASQREAR